MALTRAELHDFAERVKNAGRPLVFFDDDPDGLSAYLLVRAANPDAIGVPAMRGPKLDADFARKVEENLPDLVVILDKPRVSPDFFTNVKTDVLWLDHHTPPPERTHAAYLNPLLHNARDNRSTSYWVYRALGGPLWIAAVGTTSDWFTDLLSPLAKSHPSVLDKETTIEKTLYGTPLGELVRWFTFLLKGRSSEVKRRIATLSRIEGPEELLGRKSPRARFLWKEAKPLREEYERQRKEAMDTRVKDGLYVHIFSGLRTSLVKEVANEMLVRKSAKLIIVGRRSNDEIKFSMRSQKKDCRRVLENALKGIDGYGGGHKAAAGGAVKEKDWDAFVERLKSNEQV